MQTRSTKVIWLIDIDPMRWPVPELNDYSVQTLVDLLLNRCQHLVSNTFNFNKQEILNRLLTVINIRFFFFDSWKIKVLSGHKPQWQKSEEMMKRLEGSARYLLSSLPYSCSLDSLRAPTSTGTMLNSSLWLFLRNKAQQRIICQVPDGDLTFACLLIFICQWVLDHSLKHCGHIKSIALKGFSVTQIFEVWEYNVEGKFFEKYYSCSATNCSAWEKNTQMSNQTNWGDVNFPMPTYCNVLMA